MCSYILQYLYSQKRDLFVSTHQSRRHLQVHYLNGNCSYFETNITEVVSKFSINNMSTLVMIMVWRRIIIGTSTGLLYWRIYASLGVDELRICSHDSVIYKANMQINCGPVPLYINKTLSHLRCILLFCFHDQNIFYTLCWNALWLNAL